MFANSTYIEQIRTTRLTMKKDDDDDDEHDDDDDLLIHD